MKCHVVIDPQCEEEVRIYARERTPLVEAIERLVAEREVQLLGYLDDEIVPLSLPEIACFIVETNKVYALWGNEKLLLKQRLYRLEECLPPEFVKINQSCIANIRQIARFDASIGGSLRVCFKNEYSDYVSRRQMKAVKERVGITV